MATIATLSVLVEAKGQRAFLGDMTKVAAAVVAAGVAFDQIVARGTKVSAVLNAFTQKTRGQADALLQLRSATMGLVSDYELMQQANVALTLGSAGTVEQFSELATTAQKLGRALGLDTAFALNSLNIGIARQSRLVLDNVGIMVDATSANQAYAKSIGKTADQLTVVEQKEAFRVAAMEQARAKIAELGAVTRTAGDEWRALKVEIVNAADAMAVATTNSDGLSNLLAGQVQGVHALAYELGLLAEAWARNQRAIDTFMGDASPGVETTAVGHFAQDMTKARAALTEANPDFDAWRDSIRKAGLETLALNDRITFLGGMLREIKDPIINPLTGALLDFGDAERFVKAQTEGLIPPLEQTIALYQAWVSASNRATEANSKFSSSLSDIGAGLGVLGGVGGLFGFSVPFLSNISSGLGALFSGQRLLGSKPPGKAMGGSVSGGSPYIVGERGPELFVPGGSGSIVPNGGITIRVVAPAAGNPVAAYQNQLWHRALEAGIREIEANGFRMAQA